MPRLYEIVRERENDEEKNLRKFFVEEKQKRVATLFCIPPIQLYIVRKVQ